MESFTALLKRHMHQEGISSLDGLAQMLEDVPPYYDEPVPDRDALREMLLRRYPVHPADFHYLGDVLDLTEEQQEQLALSYLRMGS